MHDKQFFILSNEYFENTSETKMELLKRIHILNHRFYYFDVNESYTIYISEDISVTKGKYGVLLGNAYRGDYEKYTSEEILNHDVVDIVDSYEHLIGRWVLMYKNQIHLDSFGTLGLFYGEVNGARIVTSSLALIDDVFSKFLSYSEYVPLHRKGNLLWFFGPKTRINEMKRLLPSQYYLLDEGKVLFRNIFANKKYKDLSEKEIYDGIFLQQRNAFNEMSCGGKKTIDLALTAGRDSRVELAILSRSDVDFKTHSFERRKATELSDIKIPPRLVKKIDAEYRYISMQKRDNARVIEYNHHTFDSTKDMDWEFHYPAHQFDEMSSDFYIRSGYFEVFCNYYILHNKMTSSFKDSIDTRLKDLENVFDNIYRNKLFEDSLREYCEWVDDNRIEDMSWADRFAYDQMYGCWMADINQGLDLALPDSVSIHPICSVRQAQLVFALPQSLKDSRKWHEHMVKHLNPKLSKLPYNATNIFGVVYEWMSYVYKKNTRKSALSH